MDIKSNDMTDDKMTLCEKCNKLVNDNYIEIHWEHNKGFVNICKDCIKDFYKINNKEMFK